MLLELKTVGLGDGGGGLHDAPLDNRGGSSDKQKAVYQSPVCRRGHSTGTQQLARSADPAERMSRVNDKTQCLWSTAELIRMKPWYVALLWGSVPDGGNETPMYLVMGLSAYPQHVRGGLDSSGYVSGQDLLGVRTLTPRRSIVSWMPIFFVLHSYPSMQAVACLGRHLCWCTFPPNGLVGVSPIFGSTWAFRAIDPIRAEPNARLPDLKSPRAGSGIG